MVETMEDAVGVGLAAPQVYEGKRAIILSHRVNGSEKTARIPIFSVALINPEFEPVTDELALGWEGCLSIPVSPERFHAIRILSIVATYQMAGRSSVKLLTFMPVLFSMGWSPRWCAFQCV